MAEGLKRQTLSQDSWRWLIVDNCSTPPVASWIDPRTHPPALVIREDQLGLTNARTAGIRGTRSSAIAFVDDDNVLDARYLEMAVALLNRHKELGVLGGSVVGEFEEAAPGWFTEREFEMLGIRPLTKDIWGNLSGHWKISPIGAGMIVRREVANAYADQVGANDLRRGLDRRGNLLTSGGDLDIGRVALDMGYGLGRFTALSLTHLMPKERLQLSYLQKLASGIGYSNRMMTLVSGEVHERPQPRWFMRIRWLRPWFVKLRRPRALSLIDRSLASGAKLANEEWRQKSER